MGDDRNELTLTDWWERCPIYLIEHDDRWRSQYVAVEAELWACLAGLDVVRVSHIGSTAVTGIWAKDVVDILVEVGKGSSNEEVAERIADLGFWVMAQDGERIALDRGYSPDGYGDKVFHVFVHRAGDNDELYFRDYLRDHAKIASEYGALKIDLRKRHGHNREAFVKEKGEFIGKWTEVARREYPNRY